MSAPTRHRIAAQHRAEAEARVRITDRLRDQFPELGESEIEAAVGAPRSGEPAAVVGPSETQSQAGARAEPGDAPRRHRA